MKFDLSNIELSSGDNKSGLIVPNNLNVKLAELIGIVVGDGHIGIYERPKRILYMFNICGNIIDEAHMDFVRNTIFDIFRVELHKDVISEKNTIVLRKRSKAMCQFFRFNIGIPATKENISVPDCILIANNEMKKAFLRGLADTDFCITIKYKPNAYPVVHGTSKSKILIQQCSEMFRQLGIENNYCKEEDYDKKRGITYTRYRVYINGYKRVGIFMKLIGFSNENKVAKYEEALEKRNLSGVKCIPKKFL